MDEEKDVIQYDIDVAPLDAEVAEPDTIEYIIVEEPKEIVIEVDDALVATDGVVMPEHTHTVDEIEVLGDKLDILASPKEVYSQHSGYAEFHEWKDGGHYKEGSYKDEYGSDILYSNTGGVGFFVSLVTETGKTSGGNIRIDICKKINNDNSTEVTDVYGVTVDNSGFCGNQNKKYNSLDPQSPTHNIPKYAQVCLLGNVQVRISESTRKTLNVGDYVVPDEIGHAKKSTNNIGFKVISIGSKEAVGGATAWHYAEIALVPQNDNVARVMKEIEDTKTSLNNVNIQLGTVAGEVDKIVNIGISDKFAGIESIINKNQAETNQRFETVQEVTQEAQGIVKEAEQNMQNMALQYAEAVNRASDAQKTLYGEDGESGVLKDIKDLQDNMDIIEKWDGEDGNSSVVGFVTKANENSAYIASLTQTFTDNGTDLATIIQKNDENGAAIQHLVSHVDKYILGKTSPINGLSLEETAIMSPGTIYVPTKTHDEKYSDTVPITFEEGQSYMWQAGDTGEYMWKPYKSVSLNTDVFKGTEDGDLWYCWKGVEENNRYIYSPNTLYCWDNYKEIWIPVASGNYDSNITVGLVNQTAKKFEVNYTDLKEDMTSLQVKVDGISTTVENEVKHQISSIDQTAEKIMMDVYDADDGYSNSLELLLDGMTSTSTKVNIKKIKEVEVVPPSGDKYENPPIWNGSKFIFGGSKSDTGEYYFEKDTDGNDIESYYCEAAGDRYYVYGINNTAMANLSTRVTNTESEVESWTRFQNGQNETMTSINQTSDKAGAAISSMVYGEFRECIKLGKGDNGDFADDKYDKQPLWELKENSTDKWFVPDGELVDTMWLENGDSVYCLSTTDETIYYKLYYRDDNYDDELEIVEFEKYQMKSSPYASIVQKVENGKSSIGLVAGDDSNMGSIVVNTINDKSNVLIEADKIGLKGTAVFSDSFTNDKTTISGNYIRTGVISSNNYDGPITYIMYGAKIVDNHICNFTTGVNNYTIVLEDGRELLGPSYGGFDYYIGMNLNIKPGIYYYNYNDEWCEIKVQAREATASDLESGFTLSYTEYYYDGIDSGVPHNQQIDMYMYPIASDVIMVDSDDIDDCIYYTLKSNGAISIDKYYYANEIKSGAKLFATEPDKYSYIVSADDFDLVPSDTTYQGTKFDLNVGTIYSKNLSLDRKGNLTITGRITATSGYIGDEDSGFAIGRHLMYEVGKDGLNTGLYYFNVDDKYYLFNLTSSLSSGTQIIFSHNNQTVYIDNKALYHTDELDEKPDDATKLTSTDELYYSLSNNQYSLWGTRSRSTPGVYIGPDGIGLGDGAFGVDCQGNLNTMGDVTMYAKVTDDNGDASLMEVVKIDSDNGDLTLAGNIILGGSITWNASSNPVKVLYARGNITKPLDYGENDYQPYGEYDLDSATKWHKTLNALYDHYASYSYDGGRTWCVGIKIKGEDFSGGDVGLSQDDVFDMLTNGGYKQGIFPFYTGDNADSVSNAQVYINAEYIKSGTLKGRKIISETNSRNQVVNISNGQIFLMPESDSVKPKMKIGLNYESANAIYPFIQWGSGSMMNTGSVDGLPTDKGTAVMFKDATGLYINYNAENGLVQTISLREPIGAETSPRISFSSDTVVDFNNTKVEGLKITFG